MKQTAVEWLVEQLEERGHIIPDHIEETSLEMERKQILDAFTEGASDGYWGESDSNKEQYYTSTYGSKGSDDHIVDTNEMVSSQTEISDEDIEEYAKKNAFQYYEFITGAKWYREQLKKNL